MRKFRSLENLFLSEWFPGISLQFPFNHFILRQKIRFILFLWLVNGFGLNWFCFAKAAVCRSVSFIFRFTLLLAQLSSSYSYAAYSVTTTQVVHGSAPSFSETIEAEIAQGTYHYPGYGFSYGGTDYTAANIAHLSIPPGMSPKAIIAAMKAVYFDPNSEFAETDFRDPDGDDGFTLSPQTLPNTIKMVDSNGMDISGLSVTFCDGLTANAQAPYFIEVSGGKERLSTDYGLPDSSDYTNLKARYLMHFFPGICWVRPTGRWGTGPATVWAPANEAFLPQSTIDPALNFPATGFHGAKFSLTFSGINANDPAVEWIASYSGGNGSVTVKLDKVTRNRPELDVTLLGPRAPQNNVIPAGGIDKFEPVTITITDKNNTVNYSFKLQRWFVGRDSNNNFSSLSKNWTNYPDTVAFCKALGGGKGDGLANGNYVLPMSQELSDRPGAIPPYPSGPWDYEPTPTRSIGPFATAPGVGGGLFSEWAMLSQWRMSYPLSRFLVYPSSIWVAAKNNDGEQMCASSDYGFARPCLDASTATSRYAICISR